MRRISRGLLALLLACSPLLAIAGCDDKPPTVSQFDPLPGARLTSGFGLREMDPILGYVRGAHHDGYDLAAPYGAPIHAAKTGRVAFAGWLGGYGKAVILVHPGGWSTLYGHASRILVKVGQRVKAGAIIARVGSTGRSTGPHLHYELRYHGVPVDPGSFGMAIPTRKIARYRLPGRGHVIAVTSRT